MSQDHPSVDHVELRFLEALAARIPDNVRVLEALAHVCTQAGRFRRGLEIDLRLCHLQPAEPVIWYNLACSYALLDLPHEAFHALERAAELGYDGFDWMCEDGDLDSLRDDPRFNEILAKVEASSQP